MAILSGVGGRALGIVAAPRATFEAVAAFLTPRAIVEITLNAGRTVEVKKALYAAIAAGLGKAAGVRPDDVLVNLVEVARENWSFGGGVMSYPPPTT